MNYRKILMKVIEKHAKPSALKQIFAPKMTFQDLIKLVEDICLWFPINVVGKNSAWLRNVL